MNSKLLLLILSFIITGFNAEAQILKKLKKKVENTTEKVLLKKTEQKTEQVVETTFDSVANQKSNPASTNSQKPDPDANKAKLINTEAKRSFYTSDVIVRTSDSKGKGSEYYFDSEEIAARRTAPNSEYPIYIDSEGYQYAYNDGEGRWEKTGLMKSDAMSLMMPMISISMLKLPAGPTLEATEKFKNKGMNLNTFQIVEWAFIYKPEHFRTGEYEETTGPCPTGGNCPKFLYIDPEYKGSWVLFDKQGRLSEVYANVNTQQAQGDGSYKFEYSPVSVNVPSAVEVKMPFQDLYIKGLDVNSDNSTSGNTNITNNRPSETTNTRSNSGPNEKIATIDPNNPLSFPGVTSILEYDDKQIIMQLNTETMAMKLDLNDPKMKPIYFDRENYMYMESDNGCIKAKLNLEKAFTQMEEGLKGKTLPGGMDIEKIKADYYKNNFGMQAAPSNFPPITGWAYLYNPEHLNSQGKFEKSSVSCDGGSCQKFTMTEGKEKGSYVLFDKFNRLQKIYSTEGKGGSVTYSYPSHRNLKIPDFNNCQEIDINQDILGNMMGGK
ncbi:hypothetical protein LB467_10930 [Salegentibacter sp. JZCK2]|uniref:hypothetical protein n=1 Tax=Salegentibacter tibetensis TaxID=2873600 RepID=UPI001CC9BD51|nr:hypothetical protein [Salegentibacter tibetensis]MBZ9730200.1 hypothetical protein [Salegentibacter tibetensis]